MTFAKYSATQEGSTTFQDYFMYDVTSEESADKKTDIHTSERTENLVNRFEQFYSDLLAQPKKWVSQIHDLGDDNYELVEPLLILIEEYPDDLFIARFPEVEIFAEGISDSEAIQNLKVSILDLYDELTENDLDMLGDLPKAWLRTLKKVIVRV